MSIPGEKLSSFSSLSCMVERLLWKYPRAHVLNKTGCMHGHIFFLLLASKLEDVVMFSWKGSSSETLEPLWIHHWLLGIWKKLEKAELSEKLNNWNAEQLKLGKAENWEAENLKSLETVLITIQHRKGVGVGGWGGGSTQCSVYDQAHGWTSQKGVGEGPGMGVHACVCGSPSHAQDSTVRFQLFPDFHFQIFSCFSFQFFISAFSRFPWLL